MSAVAFASRRTSTQPPATLASQSFPTCRGFKVPPLDIPVTEPEAFSLGAGHPLQIPTSTYGDAPSQNRCLLSGAFLPAISSTSSSGGASTGWDQTILSVLTQAAASCVSSPPNHSPVVSAEAPSLRYEMAPHTGGLCTSGLPQVTTTCILPSPSLGFSIPHPPSSHSFCETRPKPPNSSVARSSRNSAGIAVPSSYEFSQNTRDPPALSLPPAPLFHTMFEGSERLVFSLPPPAISAPKQLSAWSSRRATSTEDTAMLTSGACTPLLARWPTREFVPLVSKWSAATSPLASANLERGTNSTVQIAVDPDTKFAASGGFPSSGSSKAFAAVNDRFDMPAALLNPVQNSPNPGPLSWGALSQLFNSLASPVDQVSNPLLTDSVRSGEPHPVLPEAFPSIQSGFAIPATPTPFGFPDPISPAFAALEQSLVRRSLGNVSGGLTDVSRGISDVNPPSSAKSGMDELRDALSLDPSLAAMLSPGTGFGMENVSSKSERIRQLSRDDIAKHFDMPISEASKRLGVGLTALKKRCRDIGIHRWPHRKLRSINALIKTVQQLGGEDNGGAEQQIGSAIQRLEAEQSSIEAAPSVKLTHETRKFRQACFKAKYKLRNLAAARAAKP